MDTIDTTGRVFFPSPDSNPIQGARLYTKENRILIEFCFTKYPPIEKCEIMTGEFNDLGQITCLYNRYYGGTLLPIQLCRYRIGYLFKGHLFTTRKEILFHNAFFYVDSLIEWFNIRTIKFSPKPNHRIDFETFPNIALNIIGYKDTSFNFGYTINAGREKTVLSEYITFSVISETSRDFMDFYKVMVNLRHFYTLFTNVKFEIEKIVFKNEDIKLFFGNKPSDASKPIELLNTISEVSPSPSSDFFYLTYSEIKDNLPDILSNWYLQNRDDIVFEYLLEKSYNKNLSQKTYFLNMCFAIEIYHKNHNKNEVLEKAQFSKIKNYLLSIVKDFAALKWLKNKLSLGNNPSFKDRLIFYKAELDNMINSDSTRLIKKIVDTRNYIVHSSASKKVITDEIEFYFTALTIEIILKSHILIELGLPSGIVENLKAKSKKALADLKMMNEYIDNA